MNKKTIWITGGSTGIGRALAIKFASKGWNVAVSARRVELLNELSNTYENIFSSWYRSQPKASLLPLPERSACQSGDRRPAAPLQSCSLPVTAPDRDQWPRTTQLLFAAAFSRSDIERSTSVYRLFEVVHRTQEVSHRIRYVLTFQRGWSAD